MESLTIKETKYTPQINMDAISGVIEMTGKSYPENTFDFYAPVMQWLNDYFSDENEKLTVINMEIIYFNSSSSKLFFDFFDVCDAKKNSHNIEINWIYEEDNENAKEAGEDFIEDFESLCINMVVKA